MSLNEFTGLVYNCPTPQACNGIVPYTGEDTLVELGFTNNGTIASNLGILVALLFGYLVLAYIALVFTVRRSGAK
jgi:hypothetical protein